MTGMRNIVKMVWQADGRTDGRTERGVLSLVAAKNHWIFNQMWNWPGQCYIIHYHRNWPQYGLRWSVLFCHSGTARVGPAVAWPLAAAPAGPTSTVPEWQNKPLEPSADRIVVNFYSTTKKKQYISDKCRDNEPPCWNVLGWQCHSDERVHGNSVRIIGQYDVTVASGSCIDDVTIASTRDYAVPSAKYAWFCWWTQKYVWHL